MHASFSSDVGLSPGPRAATSVALTVLERKHMAHAVDAPPPTPVEPVTEVLHGIEITDPYRGLEICWLSRKLSPNLGTSATATFSSSARKTGSSLS